MTCLCARQLEQKLEISQMENTPKLVSTAQCCAFSVVCISFYPVLSPAAAKLAQTLSQNTVEQVQQYSNPSKLSPSTQTQTLTAACAYRSATLLNNGNVLSKNWECVCVSTLYSSSSLFFCSSNFWENTALSRTQTEAWCWWSKIQCFKMVIKSNWNI